MDITNIIDEGDKHIVFFNFLAWHCHVRIAEALLPILWWVWEKMVSNEGRKLPCFTAKTFSKRLFHLCHLISWGRLKSNEGASCCLQHLIKYRVKSDTSVVRMNRCILKETGFAECFKFINQHSNLPSIPLHNCKVANGNLAIHRHLHTHFFHGWKVEMPNFDKKTSAVFGFWHNLTTCIQSCIYTNVHFHL